VKYQGAGWRRVAIEFARQAGLVSQQGLAVGGLKECDSGRFEMHLPTQLDAKLRDGGVGDRILIAKLGWFPNRGLPLEAW
jgi:hypothetical protein